MRAVLAVTGSDTAGPTEVVNAVPNQLPANAPHVLRDAPADRSATVRALYTGLHLTQLGPQPRRPADAESRIVAELHRAPRLVVLPAAHTVRPLGLELGGGPCAGSAVRDAPAGRPAPRPVRGRGQGPDAP
jgi:hypothetical protein